MQKKFEFRIVESANEMKSRIPGSTLATLSLSKAAVCGRGDWTCTYGWVA